MFPLRRVLHLGQLQVCPCHYYADPVRPSSYFVGLQTDLGILTHPLYLFAEGRKDVDAVSLVRKSNRHNIRLVIHRASQSSDGYAFQQFVTFLFRYWSDSHWLPDTRLER